MKKGFELLKSRGLDNPINVEELEVKYGIKLPPLYKLFVESFILGENQIKEERIISSDSEYGYQLMGCIYEPLQEASIIMFSKIENVIALSVKGEITLWHDYLPIGAPCFNGAIVVGIKGEDKDKIFLHDIEIEPALSFLASNIFEYVRGLILINNSFHLGTKFDPSKIFKNWGEDFWRVRENESE
jgi:hypothetical protein